MKRFAYVISALVLVWLVACSAPTDPLSPTPSGTGTISGTIRGTEAIGRSFDIPEYAEYVPGEVIVAFLGDEPGTVRTASMELQSIRPLSMPGVSLFNTGDEDPAEVAAYLNTQPDVRYAHPNYIMRQAAVSEPNDEFWVQNPEWFWNYEAIDVPGAWEITTGDKEIVVAVVDSGILVDQTTAGRETHPDLVDSVEGGYNFVSSDAFPGMGSDGRSNDPYDLGDHAPGSAPYHGTHVAGTIGASTDNGIGIPGVGWDTTILPLRVFEDGKARLSDVMEAAMWAAGIHVAGVPDNPEKDHAHVINMSLGAPGRCEGFVRDALERITNETSAIPIVAAGNAQPDGLPVDVLGVTPANCPQVITVAASGFIPGNPADADLAWYSNFGNRVDIVAPGGDLRSGDRDHGIFSTWGTEAGHADYGWSQGTSMAAPHVSGVVALMKSLNTELTTEEVRSILRNTATPLHCTEACGAGLINARAALEEVPLPGSGGMHNVEVSPRSLDFWIDAQTLSVSVTNQNSTSVDVNIAILPDSNTPTGWVTGPSSVRVAAGDTEQVAFAANRDVLTEHGSYSGVIEFTNAGNNDFLAAVHVLVDKRESQSEIADKTMYLLSWVPDPNALDGWAESAYYWADAPFSRFDYVTALPGENLIVAVVYADGPSPTLRTGDWVGTPRNTVYVQPGRNSEVPEFYIAPYTSEQYDLEIPEERLLQALQNALEEESRWQEP